VAILPKAIYQLDATPIKIPVVFFTDIEKSILKFIRKHRRPHKDKAILSKMCILLTMLDFKLYCRAIPIITAWQWHKNRPMA
jgi:inhibitor of KinA sporulation pathway (predicted exonuclease)